MGAASEDESNEDTNEEEITFDSVQAMINALPDAEDITEDNRSDVEAQLDAIDEAKSALYQAGGDVDGLDMTRYDAACETLEALSESDETGTFLLGSTPSLTASGTTLSSTGGTLSAGSYYLAGNVNLTTNITIPASTTVTIDLNGYILTGKSGSSVITVNGTLTLKDSSTNKSGMLTGGSATYGGVYVGSGGKFTLNSGTISGNTATYGGGVSAIDGTFVMTGGTISSNTAEYGGGVYIHYNNGKFDMRGGTISGNTATLAGGGVYASWYSTFSMSGGEILTNKASKNGGGIYTNGSSATMKSGTVSGNTADYGAGVYVVSNQTFNMENGTISTNEASTSGGGVYANGNFTMSNGAISKNSANYGGGVFTANTFTLTGGTISGNTANYGGGVRIYSGNFTMSNGAISENSALYYGGGVHIYSGAFTMSNGTISKNSATYGGGVYVDSGGTFVMNDGTISSNTASYGGGVYIYSSFTISGGSVSENTASNHGGGISSYGTLNISGSPVITNNTLCDNDGTIKQNVYLYSGKYISLGDALGATASIGVTTATAPTSSSAVQITTKETGTSYYNSAVNYIISDNENYKVQVNREGYLELSVKSISGNVSITGDAVYGKTLTATLSDSDPIGVTYQWMRGTAAISGATDSTYTLTAADVGETITVVVSHTGYAGILSASTSGEVQKATVTASISGTTTKVYDGTMDVTDTQNLSITLSGLAGDDSPAVTADFTFKDKDVGTEKAITASAITLTTLSDCYQLDSTAAEANVGSITAATVTASISGSTIKVYDGTTVVTDASGLSITLSGVMEADKGYVSASAESYAYTDANAGEAKTITADNVALSGSAAGNYILSGTSVSAAAGSITARALSENDFSVNTDPETYTGSAITKAITSLSGLTEETDYTVSNSDNVNAGTAAITINGIGNYTGELTYTFTINKAAPTVSLSGAESTIYDGTAVSDPTFSVTLVGNDTYAGTPTITWYSVADDGTETALTGAPSTAGSYKVVVTVSDAGSNYGTASASELFTITAAEQSISYSEIIVTKHINDTAFTNALIQTTLYGTISYASDDADVATVDEDGEVNIVGAGAAIITATAASSDDYNGAMASYTLTVTAHRYEKPGFTWSEGGKSCTASFTCADCGDVQIETATVASADKTSATCTGSGITLYTATVNFNGQTYTDTKEISDIPATGHSFGEWETITSPTCEGSGSEQRTCTVCGYTETRDIDPAGHDWEEEYTVDVQAGCTTDGSRSIHCKNCDAVKDSKVIPATGHTWDEGVVVTEAACEETGLKLYTCTVCQETKTDAIPASGHALTHVAAKAATCTEEGNTEHWYCEDCGKYFSDEATGTEISLADTVVPAAGHATETRNAKDATCTEDGYTGDEVCTVCKETVQAGEVISAAGHIWGKGVVTKEPTSTASGTRTYTCTVCGKTRTVMIPATGGAIKDGLVLDDDNVFRYYQNNVFAEDYVGVVPYDGGLFFIKNGLIDFGANELCLYEDVWYYVSLGQVQLQYTGLAIHDGAWFYITEGILDTTVNGLIPYDGEQFLVAAGRLALEYSGLWLNASGIGGDGRWYFLAAGMVCRVSQVVMYDGAFFVVVEGILDTGYNGTIAYGGAIFIVVNGQLYAA